MRKRVVLAACAGAILALASPVLASIPDDLIVERFGTERGFPSETITALHRGRTGFLWVGSREGLSVWDGYNVRIFEHEVGNPASLPDNSIRTIYQDRAGTIWVGTNSGGLAHLDIATGRFRSFRRDPVDPKSLSHDSVYAIEEDNDGALWVGTQDGLNRLDPRTGTFERFAANPSDPASLPSGFAYALKLDRSGRLWVGTLNAGVVWIDPKTRRITRVPFAKDPGTPAADTNVFAIVEDKAGTLWFGTERALYAFDPAAGSLRFKSIRELAPGSDVPIVTSMAVDGQGVIWLSTWNRGLVAFDPQTGVSRGFRHDPQREGSLAADRLSSVFVDFEGEAWIGSWGNGIDRFGTVGDLFHAILEPNGLPYHEVTSVFEDRDNRLWVGTWGKGLYRRSPGAAEFSGIAAPADPPLALNTVLSMAEQADGTIWAGSMATLTKIDARSGKATVVRVGGEGAQLETGFTNAVLVARSGTVWIGTGSAGLFEIEPGGARRQYVSNPNNDASLSDNTVTTLLEGGDGALWVGTRSGGLNVFDPSRGGWRRFLPSATDAGTIGHQHVSCLLESRGAIWAGTDGGGLAKIERDASGSLHVKRVTTDDGLVNQNVVSLLADDDGSLWIGTRHGLSRYDPAAGRFRNYGLGDGLPSVEFSAGAAQRGKEGLLFGTSRGLLVVRAGTPFGEPVVSPTVITEIRTLSGPMTLPTAPWETREIVVPYGTPLSFGFAVLDFRSPHRFRYRIAERGNDWTELGANRVIAFTDLSPGSYTMSVRGRSARGGWSETAAPLRIRVTPPFWMTWWFRVFGGLALAAGVFAVIGARTRVLERRNRELLALQTEREKALLEARASQEALHGAYGRLRSLTRQLEDAKEEEKRRIARELHDELGQLLSAIKINLKALGRLGDRVEERGERIADAIALVDEMIGHVREMALDLRPPLLDELGLVPALRGYAEGQSMRTGVAISVEANADSERLRPDTAIAAFRIVQEAVHNALRHASARHLTVSVRRDPTRLQLRVHDDGRGFDLDEALGRAATGRHLGLRGMRERVEALGGRLEIESTPGHGSEIRASMPLQPEEAAS